MPLTFVFKHLQGISSKQSNPHASCSLLQGEIPSTHTSLLTKDLLFLIKSTSNAQRLPSLCFSGSGQELSFPVSHCLFTLSSKAQLPGPAHGF